MKTAGITSLLSIEELDSGAVETLLILAQRFSAGEARASEEDGFVAFLSDRESVRTRLAVHRAAQMVGRVPVDLDMASSFYADPVRRPDHAGFVKAELASMHELGCAAVVARMHDHQTLRMWRDLAAVPIINGCSDEEHPLQALSDAAALGACFGHTKGLRLTLVGNGASPVFRSLLAVSARLQMEVLIACPDGYGFDRDIVGRAGVDYDAIHTHDLAHALAWADAVYSDSVVYRALTEAEEVAFAPYRLTTALVARHAPQARIMHCLPHADEIDSELIFSEQSLVMRQVAARAPVTAAVIEAVTRDARGGSKTP